MMDNVVTFPIRIQTGEVVVLKSGSPPMTVRVVAPAKGRSQATISVDWFMGEEHYSGTFFENQLVVPEFEESEE